jgi:hypothetical protein
VQAVHRPLQFFAPAAFHFYKDERLAIATNNVDLSAATRHKVSIENLVTALAKESGSQLFSARAQRVDMFR